MTKLVFISDIHGKFGEFKIPAGDILVVCGDFCPNFSWNKQDDSFRQVNWLKDTFVPFVQQNLDGFKAIIATPGNHDKCFQVIEKESREALSSLSSFHLLIDQRVAVEGLNFYGSPWTPFFGGDVWAFNFPDFWAKARAAARNCWELIPSDTDVLITHGPPKNILDRCYSGNVGCPWLRDHIEKNPPRIHAFGHIHEGYGIVGCVYGDKHTMHINASTCDGDYKPLNKPIVITL